eukprot:jgi/Hompol1/2829/HPOL_003046-RA
MLHSVPGRPSGFRYNSPKADLGLVSFDLDADLSSYFNWNTKLLFVSAIVEFSNDQYPFNQAVIWDDIIREREDAVIQLRNKNYEYMVHDLANSLSGSKANFTLQFQIVPWVGFMKTHREVIPDGIKFPLYAKKSKK